MVLINTTIVRQIHFIFPTGTIVSILFLTTALPDVPPQALLKQAPSHHNKAC